MPRPASSATQPTPRKTPLELAEVALGQSEYRSAEQLFGQIWRTSPRGKTRAEAAFGLMRTWLLVGRAEEILPLSSQLQSELVTSEIDKLQVATLVERSLVLEAKARRALGQVAEALALLQPEEAEKKLVSGEARLLAGELLLELGRRSEAQAPLMSLIEDYNDDRITEADGAGLVLVGRAAYLLSSAKDANDAFNQAERVLPDSDQLRLYRAELFLEKYDPGHAEEVLSELLKRAPNHPEANMWMARVRLDQAFDFDEAERLAKKALSVNPRLTSAYGVLAGVALREAHLTQAERWVAEGLKFNPRDLELLSLHATARYLSDDTAGFEAAKAKILAQNPEYSRMFNIIGDYAEWEHRYDEIVGMMREALQIDPENAKARAQLGLNLIRGGSDVPGVTALRHAFDSDPFNVRVYNTLDLFEKEIPKNYTTVEAGRFRFRYPKNEQALLSRYVPPMLERAFQKLQKSYGFTPESPVGIELYSSRQSFAVRTSGLPETAIQGVCFGRTLAAMSLGEEKFNLGMTLWHELSHVFHIQLSRSRVPRWFTEGLAEYETLTERPEWSREQDPDLVEALRQKKLPELQAMTQAFTRVEDIEDVATAYYASTEVIEFLAQKYGRAVFPKMLRAWGAGKRTPEVLSETLGHTPKALNAAFLEFLKPRLERYQRQFVPVRRTGSPEHAEALATEHPEDAKNLARWVLLLQRQNREAESQAALVQALKRHPKDPDLRFLRARALAQAKDSAGLVDAVGALIREGFDGYEVQMLLGEAFRLAQDWDRALLALQRAHEWDPTEVEPLRALVQLGERMGKPEVELDALRKLALLDEHNPGIYRRLLERLLIRGEIDEGVRVGEAAVYADMDGLGTHVAYAELLLRAEKREQAIFELESAALCPGTVAEKEAVWRRLADVAGSLGNAKARDRYLAEAEKLKLLPEAAPPQASPGAPAP
ncbi:MAG: hypothetical protein SFV15_06155 [Polyangiaceae bacterium]|nr:hypothetical protein [Polyangiaceae bacterium]